MSWVCVSNFGSPLREDSCRVFVEFVAQARALTRESLREA